MTLLRLSSLALSRSRFALSPLAETLGSMFTLTRPCTDPWQAEWHGRHERSFARMLDADPFGRGLIALMGSSKWLPDFVVTPPPGGMRTTLASELPAMRATPDAKFRDDLGPCLRHSWKRHDLSWLTGEDFAGRTADLFDRVWTDYVAPDWPRRRLLLERDVAYRAGLLAAYGWPAALHRMNRRSGWVGADAIRFSNQQFPDRTVGEEGMLFVPVTMTSGTWLCEAPPARYALVYPARGTATPPGPPGDGALARLIGQGRARILSELERPATSSELAATLRASLGTVGGHLTVLREAGLIAGTRIGRRVVYRRTEAGDQLTRVGGTAGRTGAGSGEPATGRTQRPGEDRQPREREGRDEVGDGLVRGDI